MLTLDNRILKSSITILLTITLILSGFFYTPNMSYGLTKEVTIHHTRLETAVVFAWSNGKTGWQKGIAPNESFQTEFLIDIGKNMKNVSVHTYDGSNFPFDWSKDTDTYKQHWNPTKACRNANEYNMNYIPYSAIVNSVGDSTSYNPSTGKMYLKYNVYLAALYGTAYNVKDTLNTGGQQKILDLLGDNPPADLTEAMNLFSQEAAKIDPKVQGYLYFVPIITEYDETIVTEIVDLTAQLSLPVTAKQGEKFIAADNSPIAEKLIVDHAVLEKKDENGNWIPVVTWQGTGNAGENTGGTIEQTLDKIGTETYRLTVTSKDGQTAIDIKQINITDKREVSGKAILELPEYTYEGHPAEATDVSEFDVDGISYSARRAYEEGVASNRFVPLPSGSGKASKTSKTTADVIFPKRGFYNVRLDVNTIMSQTLIDTKPIEVRKTPYIIDYLGGFQKQNRKQLLNISVATYPDKPIVDYYIELKDLNTGSIVTLTKDKPQENNATIKTRTNKTSGDQYFTNFNLEFLTKTPAYKENGDNSGQDFQYTIYVKDSKGDTDTAQKTFHVVPDLPPNPAILMQETFLRNQGTNTSEVISEDGSTSDGDQLERTWSIKNHSPKDDSMIGTYVNAMSMPGYKNLAFGTNQKISFHKEGVGKATVKLDVKDKWIEPTLEEYITDSDYLSASTTKTTTVNNLSPVVSIDPIFTESANLIILADAASKNDVESKVNTIKTEFLEKNIDANVQIVPVTPANQDGYKQIGSIFWNSSINCGVCNSGLVMDSEYVYRVQSEAIDSTSSWDDICIGNHTIYAMKENSSKSGTLETAWSYTVIGSKDFVISIDSSEKYVFVTMRDKNQTIILNGSNGAYLTTLSGCINGGILSSDGKRMYTVTNDCITRYDFESGTSSKALNFGGSLARLKKGKITFVRKMDSRTFRIYQFDMNSESVTSQVLPILPSVTSKYGKGDINAVDMDLDGKVIFYQKLVDSMDTMGGVVWLADPNKMSVSQISFTTSLNEVSSGSAGFVRDESGKGKYVYLCYGDKSSSNDYARISVYEIDDKGKLSTGHTVYNNNGNCYTGIAYAQYHTDENAIYIMQKSEFGVTTGTRTGARAKVALPSWKVDTSQTAFGWDLADENAMALPGRAAAFYSAENWHGTSNRIKLFNKSITKDQSATNAILKNANFMKDANNFIIDLKDDVESLNETLNILKKEGVKFVTATFDDMKSFAASVIAKKEEPTSKLAIKGDGENIASMYKDFPLDEGKEYFYSYDEYTAGKAIDLFHIMTNRHRENTTGVMLGEIAGYEDFGDPTTNSFFHFSCSNPTSDYGGLISEIPSGKGNGTGVSFTFDMEKDGYVEYNFFQKKYTSQIGYTVTHNGDIIESVTSDRYNNMFTKLGNQDTIVNGNFDGFSDDSKRLMFLKAGKHTFSLSSTNSSYLGITKVKVVSLSKEDNQTNIKSVVTTDKNGKSLVSGSFFTPKLSLYKEEVLSLPYQKDLVKESYRNTSINVQTVKVSDYLSITNENGLCPINIDAAGKISASSTWGWTESRMKGSYEFRNPYSDKAILLSYDIFKSGMSDSTWNYVYTDATVLENGKMLIPPNGYYVDHMNGENYKRGGSSLSIDNIKVALIPLNNSLDFTMNTFNIFKDKLYGKVGINTGQSDFYELDISNAESFIIKKYYSIGGNEAPFESQIGFDAEKLDGKEVMISNFKLFTKKNSKENIMFENAFHSIEDLQDNLWKLMTSGNGLIEMKDYIEPKNAEEEPALVYNKGELVRYNINYSDYENDPSKKGYWLYAHTPYNDGAHPQSAIVYDEDGNIKSICGETITDSAITIDKAIDIAKSKGLKILDKPIDRFYVDGKYTVFHWVCDDTSRESVLGGYPLYDKVSNTAELTFYIQGGGTAPWITGISTSPAKVTENNYFSINVGVDDAEKDILNLTTEVYKDRKLIFTHRQKNIVVDANGIYPVTNTGALPDKALGGKYDVVCTVRDWNGAGIDTYKFTVISDGKITGYVNHTDQWNQNRKKYNLKWFSQEFNVLISFQDYLKQQEPRTRGTNVFWSGEKFMLQAAVGGAPNKVTSQIQEYPAYITAMKSTGRKNAQNETIYTGELWDKSMINKWGRKAPQPLNFRFTATYDGGVVKTHDVVVIVDSKQDYWQLHRLW